jgi:oligogalacturonide lyase
VELATGLITQLTDLCPVSLPREVEFFRTCLTPRKGEVCFWHGYQLVVLRLDSLDTRIVYEMPRGFDVAMINCTADNRYICAALHEDLSGRFAVDILRGYRGFREYFEAKPLSRIELIALDGSGSRTVHEERCWIGHVNTSPTHARLATFCHEGPWDCVDHRIWGLDVQSGRTWRIRPQEEDEFVTHEYWHSDGETIGYHGHRRNGTFFLGHIRHDNSERREQDIPGHPGHVHSNDGLLIVGDGWGVGAGDKALRLWRWNGHEYDPPRMLCMHNGSFQTQQLHVHPRFSPDGTQVLFTSDMSGYGNVYLACVPDLGSLSALPELDMRTA